MEDLGQSSCDSQGLLKVPCYMFIVVRGVAVLVHAVQLISLIDRQEK